jgi:hypothetical protein
MSRTETPCAPAQSPGSEEQEAAPLTIQEQREALIAPLVARLQDLWSKKSLQLTADEIELLQLMSTLVRLSGIDVLEALPVANRIMPPTEPWGV